MKGTLSLLAVLFTLHSHAADNLVVDGDLEKHNMPLNSCNVRSNAFNASFKHIRSFGEHCGIDVITRSGRGQPPKSGNTKLCLAWNNAMTGDRDALALELRSLVMKGEPYLVSFWAERLPFGEKPQPIEIGLSRTPDEFGVLIFEGTPNENWTQFKHLFRAPVTAKYLTIRPKGTVNAWFAVDAIMLVKPAGTAS